jgi:hypothetical protein
VTSKAIPKDADVLVTINTKMDLSRRLEEVEDEHYEQMQEREHRRDHAMILPDDATPKPDGIFGKDRVASATLAPFEQAEATY